MRKIIRIGTRESQLAVWQANQVHSKLSAAGFASELVTIKSSGDKDPITPLYEMGVQGIFTKELDFALLQNTIDIAVHSMKDVPTSLAKGIVQMGVLERGPFCDVAVFKNKEELEKFNSGFTATTTGYCVATSSLRRKAQWLYKFPNHRIESLRGNIDTRLRKLKEENWSAAIFAKAGLERINLLPANSIELDWMLPAPAQGAIVILGRTGDESIKAICQSFNDKITDTCTRIERAFLHTVQGGCSAPVSALAEWRNDLIHFKGNVLSVDGADIKSIELTIPLSKINEAGKSAALQLLANGGKEILDKIRNDRPNH